MTLTSRQKKILGISIIVIFSVFELLILMALVGSLFTNGANDSQPISFIFMMGMLFFPLWWGIKMWRSGTGAPGSSRLSNVESIPTYAKTSIKIQTKVELPDYRKLMFRISYTSPILIYIHFIAIFIILSYAFYGGGYSVGLFIALFILYLPVAVYRNANSNYRATKCLHEIVTYDFTSETITTTGETFNSTFQWRSLHKIRFIDQWILLYTSKQVAMIIPEKAFASESDLNTFKEICRKEVHT